MQSRRNWNKYAVQSTLRFPKKPADWDAFVALLAENGCEVKRRGKTLSFRGAGWERFIRADRLGENYLEAALLDAILGRREHTPQRTVVIGAPQNAEPVN